MRALDGASSPPLPPSLFAAKADSTSYPQLLQNLMHAARRTPAFPRIAVTNRIYMVKCRSGTPYDTVTVRLSLAFLPVAPASS